MVWPGTWPESCEVTLPVTRKEQGLHTFLRTEGRWGGDSVNTKEEKSEGMQENRGKVVDSE